MGKQYATLKDVARRAHTSTATVSYILNGAQDRYVSDELRQRVLTAAQELNYVKSALASGLKGKSRGIIAITVPQFTNIFFSRLVLAVEQVARAQGYVVTMCNTFDDPDREREVLESLIQQRVDGIILIPSERSTQNYEQIRRIGVPTVIAERPMLDYGYEIYDYILIDNFDLAYRSTRYLIEKGHRNIAFLTWEAQVVSLQERLRGYQAALQEADIPYRPEYVLQGPFSPEAGCRMTRRMLDTLPQATAVVYGYHFYAQGGLPVLRENGVRIPEDLSVFVIGDPDWVSLYSPPLAHMELPAAKVGETAAQVLFERISSATNGKTVPSTVRRMFPGTFVEGSSIKFIRPDDPDGKKEEKL